MGKPGELCLEHAPFHPFPEVSRRAGGDFNSRLQQLFGQPAAFLLLKLQSHGAAMAV